MKILNTLLAIMLFTTLTFAQKSGSNVAPIINGTWTIENRGTMINMHEPDAASESDESLELLSPKAQEIKFAEAQFSIDKDKKLGKFLFRGNDLILDGIVYKCAYYSDDKFSLLRIVNENLSYSYMLERKK